MLILKIAKVKIKKKIQNNYSLNVDLNIYGKPVKCWRTNLDENLIVGVFSLLTKTICSKLPIRQG